MKHKELVNHIKGSFLKRQFLEAFLVQSAYIESLLKLYADYIFFDVTNGESYKNNVLLELKNKIEKYSLNDLINFFYRSQIIVKDEYDLLDSYRIKRNKILHDLVREIRKSDFEKELEKVCEKGEKVIENEKFKKMADALENFIEPGIEKTLTLLKQPKKTDTGDNIEKDFIKNPTLQ